MLLQGHLYLSPELLDDGAIIPRSSFVIIKRVPAARPGKGKASMYVAGTANMIPTSESVQRGSAFVHRGAMSKRFDGRDDSQTKFGMVTLNPFICDSSS